MKVTKSFLALAALMTATAAHAADKVEWKSAYTNLKADCIEVSAANENAEIDFSDRACKGFGGYDLHIDGGDLRYGPSLYLNGEALDLGRPGAFHDTASENVEWIYRKTTGADGSGTVEWKGFVYRLSVSNEEGKNVDQLIAVRLDGAKTCSLGTVKNNEAARKLIQSRAACAN